MPVQHISINPENKIKKIKINGPVDRPWQLPGKILDAGSDTLAVQGFGRKIVMANNTIIGDEKRASGFTGEVLMIN